MSSALEKETYRLIEWFKQEAIPFWTRVSIDPVTGGSYERLLASGEVDRDVNIRVRVQARQAYVYSVAASLGWCDEGEKIANGLLAYVQKNAAHPTANAGFTHLMDSEFNVIDVKQDLYDHAFFLLAFAWQHRAFGDKGALLEAEKLMAHLDDSLGDPNGGWLEGDYTYDHRRQNPHMHLFEAFMALFEATDDACWLARAGKIFTLFETRFYDPREGIIVEFFTVNWQVAEGAAGAVVEPGHMFEWVWLLDWYSRLTGRPVAHYTGSLYRKAVLLGYKQDIGLVYDSVTADGTALKPTMRCWGLTEFIKASLVMARNGDIEAEDAATRGVQVLFDSYLCAEVAGSYVDCRGENNEVLEAVAPASTLYHLMAATVELMRHCHIK